MSAHPFLAGVVLFYGKSPIHWKSKRQSQVSTSTGEAELRALDLGAKLTMQLKHLIAEMLISVPTPAMMVDNSATQTLAEDNVFKGRLGHLGTKYLYINERTREGDLTIIWVPTHENVADILTKSLPTVTHNKLRDRLVNVSF